MNDILEFQGEYRWLSNFWPCTVEYDNLTFLSVEAAYQAAKCSSQNERVQFTGLSPGAAKRLGRKVRVRQDWNEQKLNIMLGLLRQKFNEPRLNKLLIDTGNVRLVEGNRWGDRYWGVCDGRGENHLGRLLMKVRLEYQHALGGVWFCPACWADELGPCTTEGCGNYKP